jgi:hypothetical protein
MIKSAQNLRGEADIVQVDYDLDLAILDRLPAPLHHAFWDLTLPFSAGVLAKLTTKYQSQVILTELRENETRERERFYRSLGCEYNGTVARYGERYRQRRLYR